jgi:membrane protein
LFLLVIPTNFIFAALLAWVLTFIRSAEISYPVAGAAKSELTMDVKTFFELLKISFQEWSEDNIIRHSAALAFYTIFSLAPILLIVVNGVGLVFSKTYVEQELLNQIKILIGPQGAEVARQALTNFGLTTYSPIAALIGILTVLLGATAVFAEIQAALNKIWDVRVQPKRNVLERLLRQRLYSLGIVLSVGFLLFVSLLITTLLAVLQNFFAARIISMPWFWQLLNTVTSFLMITLLFALTYKYLPDVNLTWHDVGIGAGITGVLFTIGKFIIGKYLGQTAITDAYGATGSLVVMLVWVYYSALISFFGAEFTQAYTRRYGSEIRPKSHAVRVGAKSKRI